VTDVVFAKILEPQQVLPPCDTCDTFLSGGSIPDAFCLFPVHMKQTLLFIPDPLGAGVLFFAR
jgi:hypothetical protein